MVDDRRQSKKPRNIDDDPKTDHRKVNHHLGLLIILKIHTEVHTIWGCGYKQLKRIYIFNPEVEVLFQKRRNRLKRGTINAQRDLAIGKK